MRYQNTSLTTRWLLIPLVLLFGITSIYGQGIRKPQNELSSSERDALMDAYFTLGGSNGFSGLNFEIADFHDDNFNAIHFNNQTNDVFLAWHRQASHELQLAMQAIDPWITIPYWDWTFATSTNDPLWASNYLGQFNSPWSLNRSLGNGGGLASQAAVDAALQESNFFEFSRNDVEPTTIHAGPHGWVGGTMSSGSSPRDPAFFFHHNMVDKIWADWYEIHGVAGANYYVQTSMPRYPNVDPDDVADPRSLGIFYAEAGQVVLDKYSVTNNDRPSEKFGYQFTIIAENDFTIPSGKDAEMKSCNEIILDNGFLAAANCVFAARIDDDCNFATEQGEIIPPVYTEEESLLTSSRLEAKLYPNPVSDVATLQFELTEDRNINIQLVNNLGQQVQILENGTAYPSGVHTLRIDTNQLSKGIYYCQIQANEITQILKFVVTQ